ncbi:hypothetical protein TNCV_2061151 [Trichonephila clavipes]|nr:hypothetical protein TNCV_2061151 [Trichonephila clavipes]
MSTWVLSLTCIKSDENEIPRDPSSNSGSSKRFHLFAVEGAVATQWLSSKHSLMTMCKPDRGMESYLIKDHRDSIVDARNVLRLFEPREVPLQKYIIKCIRFSVKSCTANLIPLTRGQSRHVVGIVSVESCIRVLVPLKIYCVERLTCTWYGSLESGVPPPVLSILATRP